MCSYPHANYIGSVGLNDFVSELMLHLQRTRKVSLQAKDYRGERIHLDVTSKFPAATRLGSARSDLIELIQSTHAAAADELARRISRSRPASESSGRNRRRKKPDAFICHDSRDKLRVARPIAEGLSSLMCAVWYDEFSLRVGDLLRESIERGLKTAGKCIVILSPRFFQNVGWTKTEFEAAFSSELIRRKNIILPVWAGVTVDEVFEYCPSLTNRFAVNWKLGADEVVRQLYYAIRGQ